MSLTALDNLVRIGQLKAEPRNDAEIRRMLSMAHTRLQDALLPSLSLEGRLTSAYNAAHGGALAALRWHGYRCENRFTVFQCLVHTWGGNPFVGACWMRRIKNVTSQNTRASLKQTRHW